MMCHKLKRVHYAGFEGQQRCLFFLRSCIQSFAKSIFSELKGLSPLRHKKNVNKLIALIAFRIKYVG